MLKFYISTFNIKVKCHKTVNILSKKNIIVIIHSAQYTAIPYKRLKAFSYWKFSSFNTVSTIELSVAWKKKPYGLPYLLHCEYMISQECLKSLINDTQFTITFVEIKKKKI